MILREARSAPDRSALDDLSLEVDALVMETIGHTQSGATDSMTMSALILAIDAARAERLGLANAVIGRDDLESGVERFVGTLRAVDPLVSRSIKALMLSAASSTPFGQLEAERNAQVPLLRRVSGSSG